MWLTNNPPIRKRVGKQYLALLFAAFLLQLSLTNSQVLAGAGEAKPGSAKRLDSLLSKKAKNTPASTAPSTSATESSNTGQSKKTKLDAILDGNRKNNSTSKHADKAVRQTEIAYDYLRGENGKSKDFDKARAMFRKAANAGYVPAMVGLSGLVSNSEAASLLFRAADRNSSSAMQRIAMNFASGLQGFPKDYALARDWANKANTISPGSSDLVLMVISDEQANDRERQQQAIRAKQQRQQQLEKEKKQQQRREQEALAKLEREYQQQLKQQREDNEKAAQRARARAEADAAAEQNAQLWRDTVSHIEKVGDEVVNDLRKVQKDTQSAFRHDRMVQKRNEEKLKRDFEQKKQAILAENERKRKEHERLYGDQDFSRRAALADASNQAGNTSLMPSTNSSTRAGREFQERFVSQAQQSRNDSVANPGWDCENHWRPEKCDDRIVTHTINDMGATYTGTGRNIAGQNASSSATPAGQNSNDKPRIAFKKKAPEESQHASSEGSNEEHSATENNSENSSSQKPARILPKSKITSAALSQKAVAGEPGMLMIITDKAQIRQLKKNTGATSWGTLNGWPGIRTLATCVQSDDDAKFEVQVKNTYRTASVTAIFSMYVVTPTGSKRYPVWDAVMAENESYSLRTFTLENTDCLTGATIIKLGGKSVRFKEDSPYYASPNNR